MKEFNKIFDGNLCIANSDLEDEVCFGSCSHSSMIDTCVQLPRLPTYPEPADGQALQFNAPLKEAVNRLQVQINLVLSLNYCETYVACFAANAAAGTGTLRSVF
jgi:hypothetical protein